MLRLSAILTLFVLGTLASGCVAGGDPKANTRPPGTQNAANEKAAPQTNVEELGVLIRVPYEAEDVVWKEVPASKKVVAVLLFSKQTAERIVADALAIGPGQQLTIPSETWFPDELIAQSEMSGDATLRGTAYPANAFFQDKYNAGRITRIEGGEYFIVEVSAQ